MDKTEIRKRLEQERERLQNTRRDAYQDRAPDETENESTGELADYDQHPADVATETFEHEQGRSIREGFQDRIEEIDWALRRLEDGSYGFCQACGKPIGEERLAARPAARFCIDDQERQEDRTPSH